ncbi:aldehyde-activating protein [Erythrobacter sp. SG61-1L]|nr:GFA family protein [Erythrobacter sp. SG61-1L]KPL69031.1 aldehyde-activating protein [Erythrobacter sp. SG61-1L]
MRQGGCQCGTVRYAIEGDPVHHALCHCADCRASAGAPMVAWLAVKESQLHLLSGELSTYEGKNGALRQFCPLCGTGLFYRNEAVMPGLVDIQSATLDDTARLVPGAHIQCAERLPWMTMLGELPEFERFPGG